MNLKKIAVIILSSVLLTGCNQSVQDKNHGLDKDSPTTITLGTLEDTSLQNMVDTFNSTDGKSRGINIQLETVSSVDELSSMDMISADYNTIYSLCSTNKVSDLSKYFSSTDLGNTYLDTSIESISLSGLKAIPIKLDVNVLVLNQTAWNDFANANGIDTSSLYTWEGLISVADTYYKNCDGKPFLSVSSMYDVVMETSYQISSSIVKTAQSGASINLSANVMQTVWNNLCTPQIKGLFTDNGFSDVEAGNTIASYCPLSDVPNDSNLLVLKAPYTYNGTDSYILNTTSIAVTSLDENVAYIGSEFIKWLTSEENNYKYALDSGSIPANKNCLEASNMRKYLYNEENSYNVNATGEMLALDLIYSNKCFKVSPFDNIYVLKTTIESRTNKVSSHDIAIKRLNSGVLESRIYDGILDDSSFKSWYDDICNHLRTTFNEQQ